MKIFGLATLLVLGFVNNAHAELRAGDKIRCANELVDAIALTHPEPRTPLSAPEVPMGRLICGIAPGAILRVIESGTDRYIVELRKGRVNMVTAEDGGASRDLDHQYFAIPKSAELASGGACVVLPHSVPTLSR